jgi:hypothetical protein
MPQHPMSKDQKIKILMSSSKPSLFNMKMTAVDDRELTAGRSTYRQH